MGNAFSAIIRELNRVLYRGLLGIEARSKPTLLTVPAELLDLILHFIVTSEPLEPFSHERRSNAALIPLSLTCRKMRASCCTWIFREIYTWRREEDVWPETLWNFPRTVHIRDHSIRHPAEITLTANLFRSLLHMSRLNRVTLRLKGTIPHKLFTALSMVPTLSTLEIYQTRLDVLPSTNLSFPALTTLTIRISGFDGTHRPPDIDTSKENFHVSLLLTRISSRLKSLAISGDLLEPKEFLRIAWPNLLQFTLADHPTIPFTPITQLVTHMPMLRSLSALHTTDFTKKPRPPFTFGLDSGPFLTETCPHLTSVSLSNFGISDPIFLQLPDSLDELHLLALRDSYGDEQELPDRTDPITTPLNIDDAIALVDILPQFGRLQKLSIILNYILMQPEFVVAVASKFRHLTSLHLIQTMERAVYQIPLIDGRDPETIDALRLFLSLDELKITLDDLNNPCRGVPNQAAYQLFRCLPKLQTVGIVWKVSDHEEADFWNYWDRSMLLDPEPEPLPEYFEYIKRRR